MISVILQGRIGNQLFIYAFAEAIRRQRKYEDEEIVIYDYEILRAKWKNSMIDYPLHNIRFLHQKFPRKIVPFFQFCILKMFYRMGRNKSYRQLFEYEKKYQPYLNRLGIIACENGLINYKLYERKNLMLMGYFQSPVYFSNVAETIIETIRLKSILEDLHNEDLEKIKNRESVCISIKVEHNIGSQLYDVCTKKYWDDAIKYIMTKVENPLFFVCSDNVQYVLENLIDTENYDYICQDKNLPVHVSLAVMGYCKHFVIGNTSFGWWAQKISSNPNKIVIAPKPWMKVDMPVDIYEKDWHIIEV